MDVRLRRPLITSKIDAMFCHSAEGLQRIERGAGNRGTMSQKRSVEVFTAGCKCCDEAVALVKRIACSSCEVTIHDMKQERSAKRAKELGIRLVPAVAIDGKFSDCCLGGVNEQTLRAAGIGTVL